MIGLVLGGLLLLLLLIVGGTALAIYGDREQTAATTTTSVAPDAPTTTRSPGAGTGPTTSVAGTGPPASVTSDQAEGFLREEQEKVLPDVPVLSVDCPPEPYRVGHVILCRMVLQTTPVVYQVTITGEDALVVKPARPIIDTDKAEALVQQNEVGSVADCGTPRIRQVDIGATFTCRTAASTWEFTVRDDKGQVSGIRR